MKKLNCFVASAFGYSDIDKIYSKAIVPVLKELQIIPKRVDKINHNNKIDNKIIELINQCDIGIADLTHARPSVYYEAGFIEGLRKDVVYICRRDHFTPKAEDKYGNSRIHFDLITQNIIPWDEANEIFKRKLKARIHLLTKAISIKPKNSIQEIQSKLEFSRLSINEKIQCINEEVKKYILSKGFSEIKLTHLYNVFQKGKTRVNFETNLSLTESLLDNMAFANWQLSEHEKFKLRRIFISLKPMPYTRVENVFRNFQPVANNSFVHKHIKLFFLDSIDSIFKLLKKLEEVSFK